MTEFWIRIREANFLRIQWIRIQAHNTANLDEEIKQENLRHVALYKRLLNQVKGGAVHILHK
jgi:hypothetical protein